MYRTRIYLFSFVFSFFLIAARHAHAHDHLIWEYQFSNINPVQATETDFLPIIQIREFDYVETDFIGIGWDNVGRCKELYPPRVFVRSDELSDRFNEIFQTTSSTPRTRTRHRVDGAQKMQGVFFYEVPKGMNIAMIKLGNINIRKGFDGGGHTFYWGTCRFKIYARDGVFNTYPD